MLGYKGIRCVNCRYQFLGWYYFQGGWLGGWLKVCVGGGGGGRGDGGGSRKRLR